MNKGVYIGLHIVCIVLIAIISSIAWAWHEGVLQVFATTHQSFNTEAPLLDIATVFAKYAWLMPLMDVFLYVISVLVLPFKKVVVGFVCALLFQIILMLTLMYSSLITLG